MTDATKPAGPLAVSAEDPLLVPTAEVWHAMTPEQRLDRQVAINEALGVDRAILDDNLRFLSGEATLPLSSDLIGRLRGIQQSLEAKAEEAQAKAEQAQASAEQAQARADQALAGSREGLLTILDVRGIACPDEARARIESCAEPSLLRRWFSRAKTVGSVEELFAAASSP